MYDTVHRKLLEIFLRVLFVDTKLNHLKYVLDIEVQVLKEIGVEYNNLIFNFCLQILEWNL